MRIYTSDANRAYLLNVRWAVAVIICLVAAFFLNTTDSAFAKRHKHSSKTHTSHKKNKKTKKPRPNHLFAIVSIGDQHVSFYGKDGLYARGRVSTGRSGHRTPTGVFNILQKQRYHESNLYNSAPMPYMQRITWSGVAMHQGVVPGYPASHGCIRMPYAFAKRMYGVTKVGQRVLVVPHDIKPERIAHSNLPVPVMQIAPGEPAAADTDEGTTHISAPISGYAPQQALPNAFEDISLKNVSPPKRLNPKEYAWELRKKAKEDKKAAAKALKEARALLRERKTEAKTAARATRSAKNAVSNWQDEIAIISRKIKRLNARAERYQEIIDAKAAFEAGVADKQKRLEAARQFKLAKDQELTEAWKDASEAEAAEGDATLEDQIAAKKEDEARTAAKAITTAKAALREAEYDLEGATRKAERAEKRKARVDEDIAEATEERQSFEERISSAQKTLEEARRVQAEKDQALVEAEEEVKSAKAASRLAQITYKTATRRLEPVSVFISRKTGRLYVRQDFKSVFDVAVKIKEPERPIGTHVLVATNAETDGQVDTPTLRWWGATVPDYERKKHKKKKRSRRKHRKNADANENEDKEATATIEFPPETIAGALDRIDIPGDAKQRIAELSWAGATILISDRGMSGETGLYTDFIVQTRAKPSTPRKKRHRRRRQRRRY